MVDDAIKEHDAEGGGRVTHAQLQMQINAAREVTFSDKKNATNCSKLKVDACGLYFGITGFVEGARHAAAWHENADGGRHSE